MSCATRLVPPDDDAYELVISVAAGELSDVMEIADRLRGWVT